MTPYYSESGITLYVGDCLEVLPTLPAESVDAIVTDPPYHLTSGNAVYDLEKTGAGNPRKRRPKGAAGGFMGKAWDGGDIAFRPEVWEAVLRVSRPGAHLLAFGGTRTSHRLVCAIEDAGWEIRDTLMWVYGSGFPKSLDVSKAIDKLEPRVGMFDAFAQHFAERREASGLTQKQIARHFPSKTGGLTGCVWNWENGANVPTLEQWQTLRPMLGLSDEWLPLIERVEAEREVIGTQASTALAVAPGQGRDRPPVALDVTAPATEAAKQWDGWGTALKPAVEPICLARKPLVGTVAGNVQRYGTGALNIDGCRIGTEERFNPSASSNEIYGQFKGKESSGRTALGRWPANLMHDGSPEVVECFPEETRTAGNVRPTNQPIGYGAGATRSALPVNHHDTGSAARFFYCCKASKADRYSEAGNDHPTVKPLALIQYLIRLITPPGGVVLDPFSGSGTTPKAARDLGFRCIAIDLEERHQEIAKHRLNQTVLDFGGAA